MLSVLEFFFFKLITLSQLNDLSKTINEHSINHDKEWDRIKFKKNYNKQIYRKQNILSKLSALHYILNVHCTLNALVFLFFGLFHTVFKLYSYSECL